MKLSNLYKVIVTEREKERERERERVCVWGVCMRACVWVSLVLKWLCSAEKAAVQLL